MIQQLVSVALEWRSIYTRVSDNHQLARERGKVIKLRVIAEAHNRFIHQGFAKYDLFTKPR